MTEIVCEQRNEIIRLFSSPTLDTVEMVEKTIEKYSGEFKKTQLWEKLPKQVMWGTYLKILDYLQQINKIIVSKKGIFVYIWDKKNAEKFMRESLVIARFNTTMLKKP